MNDTPENPGAHKPDSPYSKKLEEFLDALQCLYIRNNSGGRRIFANQWPAATSHIFDPQLLIFDEEGIGNDSEKRKKREALERQAEKNRDTLLTPLENIEKLSVNDGMLVTDFVKNFINTYGKDLALYVYSDFIVEKISTLTEKEKNEDEEEMKFGNDEEDTQEIEKKPKNEDEEILLSQAERSELLEGMVPRFEEEDISKKEKKKKKVPRKERTRDPNYRPPVVSSSASSENKKSD